MILKKKDLKQAKMTGQTSAEPSDNPKINVLISNPTI